MNNSLKCTASLVTSEAMLPASGEQGVRGWGDKGFVMVTGTKKPLGKSPHALFPLPRRWQTVPTQAPAAQHPPSGQEGAWLGGGGTSP